MTRAKVAAGLGAASPTPFLSLGLDELTVTSTPWRRTPPHWRCRGLIVRPAGRRNSTTKCRGANPILDGNVLPQAAVRRLHARGLVLRLSLGRYPAAIAGLIATVNINALNGEAIAVAGTFCPSLESCEVAPFFAYGYAAPPVTGVHGVRAARPHVLPDDVKARSARAVPPGPIANSGARTFAAARNGFSISQVGPNHTPLNPARALAAPNRTAAWRVSVLHQNKPASKLLARYVNQSRVFSHG